MRAMTPVNNTDTVNPIHTYCVWDCIHSIYCGGTLNKKEYEPYIAVPKWRQIMRALDSSILHFGNDFRTELLKNSVQVQLYAAAAATTTTTTTTNSTTTINTTAATTTTTINTTAATTTTTTTTVTTTAAAAAAAAISLYQTYCSCV